MTVTVTAEEVKVDNRWVPRTGRRPDFDRRRLVEGRFSKRIVLMGPNVRPFSVPAPKRPQVLDGTWIGDLPDAHRLAAKEAEAALMADPRFGEDPSDRAKAIALWRSIALSVAMAGGALAGAAFLAFRLGDGPPPWLVLALAVWAPFVVLLGLLSRGRLWLAAEGHSVSAVAIVAMFPPMLLLLDTTLTPYVSASEAVGWGLGLAGVGAGMGAGLFAVAVPRRRGWAAMVGALLGAMYGGGFLAPLDVELDFAAPKVEERIVKATERNYGRHTTYFATLIDPGAGEETEARLTSAQFDLLQAGDAIRLLTHPGRLGVAWQEVLVAGQKPRTSWVAATAQVPPP